MEKPRRRQRDSRECSIRRHPSLLLCFFPDSLQGTRESHSVKQRNCPCLPVAVGVAELDVDQALVRSVAREKHHSFKRIKHLANSMKSQKCGGGRRSVSYAAGPALRLMHEHI